MEHSRKCIYNNFQFSVCKIFILELWIYRGLSSFEKFNSLKRNQILKALIFFNLTILYSTQMSSHTTVSSLPVAVSSFSLVSFLRFPFSIIFIPILILLSLSLSPSHMSIDKFTSSTCSKKSKIFFLRKSITNFFYLPLPYLFLQSLPLPFKSFTAQTNLGHGKKKSTPLIHWSTISRERHRQKTALIVITFL